MSMNQLLDAIEGDACLTIEDLCGNTRICRQTISTYMGGLVRRGLVERVERGCFRLTAEGHRFKAEGRRIKSGPMHAHTGPRKPSRKTLLCRAWRAIRTMNGKPFTTGNLLEVVATGEENYPEANLRTYLRLLHRAGYLRRYDKRRPDGVPTSNGQVRYALIHDTGPQHPVPRCNRTVLHDPNTGERIPLTEGEV